MTQINSFYAKQGIKSEVDFFNLADYYEAWVASFRYIGISFNSEQSEKATHLTLSARYKIENAGAAGKYYFK